MGAPQCARTVQHQCRRRRLPTPTDATRPQHAKPRQMSTARVAALFRCDAPPRAAREPAPTHAQRRAQRAADGRPNPRHPSPCSLGRGPPMRSRCRSRRLAHVAPRPPRGAAPAGGRRPTTAGGGRRRRGRRAPARAARSHLAPQAAAATAAAAVGAAAAARRPTALVTATPVAAAARARPKGTEPQ